MDPIKEMGVAQSRVNFCKKYNFKSLELYFMQKKTLHNYIQCIKQNLNDTTNQKVFILFVFLPPSERAGRTI